MNRSGFLKRASPSGMGIVGLSAAMAMNCKPCTSFYIRLCKSNNVSADEIDAVLVKVMAVAAGQKRLQATEAFEEMDTECGCASQ